MKLICKILILLIATAFLCISSMAFAKDKALNYRIYIKNASSKTLNIQYLGASQEYPAKAGDFVLFAHAFDIGHDKNHHETMTLNFDNSSCSFKIHSESGLLDVTGLDLDTEGSNCNDQFIIENEADFTAGTVGDEPGTDKGSVAGDIEEAEKGSSLKFVIADKNVLQVPAPEVEE